MYSLLCIDKLSDPAVSDAVKLPVPPVAKKHLLYFIHAAPNVTFISALKLPRQRSTLPVGK